MNVGTSKLLHKILLFCLSGMIVTFYCPAFSQIFSPESNGGKIAKRVKPQFPIPEHRIVPGNEASLWPFDKNSSGEKLWAETTWGGDSPTDKKLFNYNTWGNRVVFHVSGNGESAKGEVFWRRSGLSIRLEGLKIVSARTSKEIKNAVLSVYTRDKAVIEFEPVDGQGDYYLYYGARDKCFFGPDSKWIEKTKKHLR